MQPDNALQYKSSPFSTFIKDINTIYRSNNKNLFLGAIEINKYTKFQKLFWLAWSRTWRSTFSGEILHLLFSLRIPEMQNSLSLGTEAAGTAKISWEIFGSSVQKSPEVSYPLKYSNWSHYGDNSTCDNQNSSGSDWNSWGSSFSRASALSLSTNSTAFLSYKARSFAPDSELLERRVSRSLRLS